MNFGEKIKYLRNERDWTQDYVAKMLNISVPALSRYESGTYEPKSMSMIVDFARLYDVSVDYLLRTLHYFLRRVWTLKRFKKGSDTRIYTQRFKYMHTLSNNLTKTPRNYLIRYKKGERFLALQFY